MPRRRLPGGWIERGQFYRHLGPGRIQKLFHRCCARAEFRGLKRLGGQPRRVYGRAVPQRVDPGDGEGKLLPLLAHQSRQRAPHVAVTDNGQVQGSIVACGSRQTDMLRFWP